MKLVERFFRKKSHNMSDEYREIVWLENFFDDLLDENKYIPRSSYLHILEEKKRVIHYFAVLSDSGMLKKYCRKNGINFEQVLRVTDIYENIEVYAARCNELFLRKELEREKLYLDTILTEVDSNIMLDEDQRRVVLTDEDYCLVVAGAGTGKTTTVAAKVKYLVEKKDVAPSQILIVSFTNKAVKELKDKINKELGIVSPISTFHAVGNAIIHINMPDEPLHIVDNSKLYYVLRDYFRNTMMKKESVVNSLILFFASYFDAPYEGEDLNKFFHQIAKANFSTMRSDLEDFRREVIDQKTKKKITIQNEVLRSFEEVEIANFLYLNNIDYEYEPIYPYNILYARKPYTPDFLIVQGDKKIYIEHFGITEQGENNRYDKVQLEKYKAAINRKVLLHREHKTELLYTFSSYTDGKSTLEHLQSQLESKGIQLCAKPNQEVMEKLVTGEENRYIRKLLNLVCRFISNFKVNGYVQGDFNRMQYGTKNVRTKLFLEICEDCYLEYQRYLKENKAVDFQDMINESVKILEEVKEMKQKLDFKYIIVDEYQDISRQRFDLTTMLAEVTDAKIIAVGDDWQSIYAFSGSDISLFTDFQEKMGYAELLKIVKTYRNSQEVIDIAGSFIQKNKGQMIKQLQSNKQIVNPVIIYTYDSTYKRKNDNRRTGVTYAMAYAVEVALKQIITYTECEQRKQGNILILGRFGFDGDHLEKSGLFEYIRTSGRLKSVKYPKLDITFMTAHASKGLGYDNVIVMNGKNELYGFPSKIEDDPVLSLVLKDDHAISYAEERRLFYVAMTRTKQRVYFIAPEQNPSEFLLEIKQNYKNVILRGRWNESPPKRIGQKTCPICGYPMQLKYKNGYGLRLYICTNEPEICGFMTNSYQAGKLHIMKCNQCQDGYLIAKKGRDNEYFLGCSNYKRDNSGCKNKMSRQDFYAMMGYPVEEMRNNSKEERLKNKIFQPAICLFEPKLPDFGQVMDISGLGKQMVIVEGESVEAVNGRMQAVEKHKNIHVNNENKMVMGESIEEIHEEMVEIHPKEMLQVWYHEQDLNQILTRMLNALLHISSYRYYGIGMYLDILMGEESKRIRETKLNKIPEYGILHKMQREELTYIVNWMIQNEWILQTKGRYPVLHPTYKGMHYSEYITKGMLEKLKGKLEEMRIKWI